MEPGGDSRQVSLSGKILSVIPDGLLIDCGSGISETYDPPSDLGREGGNFGGTASGAPMPSHDPIYGVVFLRDAPQQSSAVDGDSLSCSGKTSGRFRYRDPDTGAPCTVRMIDYLGTW